MTGSSQGSLRLSGWLLPPFVTACAWAIAGLLVAASAASPLQAAPRLEEQIVRLHVSKHEIDRNAPWQFGDLVQQTYLGAVVPGGLILTTAYAVADAGFIEIQRFGASRRDEAKIEFADYEADLALVRPIMESTLAGLTPVTVGDDLTVDDHVDLYKARDPYQLARIPAILQDVGTENGATSNYLLVRYLLKVQQTGLGWSEPVFRQGQLVGLTSGQDANFVHALPAFAIKHFLADKPGKDYRGFPSLGINLTPLTSPDHRRLIGATALQGGVRVASIEPRSAFLGQLKVDDVVVEVDGVAVSDQGFIAHPSWGKVQAKYLLNQHFAGDVVELKVVRGGKEMVLKAPVRRHDSNDDLVRNHRYGNPEPHLIFGGLVFQELSAEYFSHWGREWRDYAPFPFLYTLEYLSKERTEPGQRVVFVSRTLPDEFNRGYSEARYQIVKEVNGRSVTSLASLREALQQPVLKAGRRYARINFRRDGGEVILDMAGIAAAHRRIAKTYEIKSPAAFFAP